MGAGTPIVAFAKAVTIKAINLLHGLRKLHHNVTLENRGESWQAGQLDEPSFALARLFEDS